MVKEVYTISVFKSDEELNIESAEFLYESEFENYPTEEEIRKAIKYFNGDTAKIEKRYKLMKS